MVDDLLGPKVGLLVSIGFVTLAASVAPWFIAAKIASTKAIRVISTASAASSGVVVGAFLCHLLPDAAEHFATFLASQYDEEDKIVDYPFAGMICGVSLIVLITIDALIVRKGFDAHADGHAHGAGNHDHITEGILRLQTHVAVTSSNAGIVSPDASAPLTKAAHFQPLEMESPPERQDSTASSALSKIVETYHAPVGSIPHAQHRNFGSFESSTSKAINAASSSQKTNETQLLLSNTHNHDHGKHTPASRKTLLRAWVFFIALSFHGIFDGLSVGSESDATNFTSIVIAVASHKLFDGLSLGCAIFPANLPKLHRWVLLVVAAFTTPLGIGIGIAADNAVDGTHVALVNGIVLSIAAGSFAFISLMELLPSSMADGKWIPLKLLVFAAGFAGMAILAAFV